MTNLAQNSDVPRSQGEYITQVSEVIEGKVTKMLTQEFIGRESRTLGALRRFDDFLQNPLVQGHPGSTPGTSRITLGANHGKIGDDSECNPNPE